VSPSSQPPREGDLLRLRLFDIFKRAIGGSVVTAASAALAHPTRFERMAFGVGARCLRANGQTDGWPAHLASDAGIACRRRTHPSKLIVDPLTMWLHRPVRRCTSDAADGLNHRVQSRVHRLLILVIRLIKSV
jgi:hypothetical protein